MFKIVRWMAVIAPLGLATLAGPLFSAPIVYSYVGIGSGQLGTQSFSGAEFAIVAQADTANIMPWMAGALQNTHSSATISIEGIGAFNILTASHTWIGQNFGGGLGGNLALNWVTIDEAAFSSVGYGLATSLGPVVDNSPQHVVQFFGVATSGGSLRFSSIQSITFTATAQGDAGAVPEPTTAALLFGGGLALAAATSMQSRRRRL